MLGQGNESRQIVSGQTGDSKSEYQNSRNQQLPIFHEPPSIVHQALCLSELVH